MDKKTAAERKGDIKLFAFSLTFTLIVTLSMAATNFIM